MSGGTDYYRCMYCRSMYNDYTDFKTHEDRCNSIGVVLPTTAASTTTDYTQSYPMPYAHKNLEIGGTKFDTNKPRLDLVSSKAIIKMSQVLTFGAKKYADHNWRKGFKYSRLISATLRHIAAYNDGEDLDPETQLSHISHAMCCLMFLSELQETKPELDDRYKPESNDSQKGDK